MLPAARSKCIKRRKTTFTNVELSCVCGCVLRRYLSVAEGKWPNISHKCASQRNTYWTRRESRDRYLFVCCAAVRRHISQRHRVSSASRVFVNNRFQLMVESHAHHITSRFNVLWIWIREIFAFSVSLIRYCQILRGVFFCPSEISTEKKQQIIIFLSVVVFFFVCIVIVVKSLIRIETVDVVI